MPKIKIKKKSNSDKFYTKESVAIDCIKVLKEVIGDIDFLLIEPSAGSGAFSRNVECLSFDLLPEHESIKRQDFFELQDEYKNFRLCFFGNPPFGDRNHLTNSFIKKCLSFSTTEIIAFVLPSVYNKKSMQKVFPSTWKLVSSHKLPDNSFLLYGDEYHVPCVFQIWCMNDYNNMTDIREVSYPRECSDFSFVGSQDADIFVFGAAPTKIISPKDVRSTNRGHFLKAHVDIPTLCDRICSVDWKTYAASSVNGGVAWFNKDEFMKFYQMDNSKC